MLKRNSSSKRPARSKKGSQAKARTKGPSPAQTLAKQIRSLMALSVKGSSRRSTPAAPALPGQPFDSLLLRLSPLYRQSRKLYLQAGGQFAPSLISSPRALGSAILLTPTIEYSPTESELAWVATDPIERRDPAALLHLRTFTVSVFHEQNHRILWQTLPPPGRSPGQIRKYLNLAEALVVSADMALSDSLARDHGPGLAQNLYHIGSIYDPGTPVLSRTPTRRDYRNYLQAALHATYLNLELYDPRDIPGVIESMFPALGPLATHAAERAVRLDRAFVMQTNPIWQKKHAREVGSGFSAPPSLGRSGSLLPGSLSGASLVLPDEPGDNRLAYLLAESFFDRLGI